jgi:hypothetical protein
MQADVKPEQAVKGLISNQYGFPFLYEVEDIGGHLLSRDIKLPSYQARIRRRSLLHNPRDS